MDPSLQKSMYETAPPHGEGANAPQWIGELEGTHAPYEDYHGPRYQGSWNDTLRKTAENPLPQEFLTRAPEQIDTLRDQKKCPICSEEMDGETCDVCGYVEPPKEFDNPDLTKAVEMRDRMKQMEQQQDIPPAPGAPGQPGQPGAQPGGPLTSQLGGPPTPPPTKMPPTAKVKSDMSWTPQVHPRTAARINQVERPVSNTQAPASDEPAGAIIKSDQSKPVTSAMLTAQRLMATAQRNHQGDPMSTRTADGSTPPDAGAGARVDVTGVGGVMDSSNEEASRAEAQTDVTGIGGTGVEGVEADSTTSLTTASPTSDDSGFNKDKTTGDSGPTKTWGDSDGSSHLRALPGIRRWRQERPSCL
jgi:hypothetical protein